MLDPGQQLTSPSGAYRLVMQTDGNLVLYKGTQALWATGGNGPGARAVMQADGNFVVYNGSAARWSSATAGFSHSVLQLQDDGNLVIYDAGRPIWTWSSGYMGHVLAAGEQLTAGHMARSLNGRYAFVMQGDGNLVLYGDGQALWATGGSGAGSRVVMQTDGNLVVYDGSTPKWTSNGAGFDNAFLAVQDDGNVVEYQNGHAIWSWRSGYIGDTLLDGATLDPGAYLKSPDHAYMLVMQNGDGNLALYGPSGPVWSAATSGHPGARAIMQGDGNFVVYAGSTPLWATGTAGQPGGFLRTQDDGNLVVYNGGIALWDRGHGLLGGGQAIVNAAASMAGKPYCFGGGNEYGPTHGSGNTQGATQCPGATVGFDCTGLTQYAAYQGTHGAVDLTHHNTEQAKYAPGQWITNKAALLPGDIVYYGTSRDSVSHSAVYEGVVNGKQMVWDANIAFWIYPDGVHERALDVTGGAPFVGAARVWAR